MIAPRWHKVARDLWHNKTRTLLVIISIAVGVFAVGAVAGAQVILARDLNAQYQTTNDRSASIFASQLDEDFAKSIARMPEVREAELRSVVVLRVRHGDRRSNLILYAINNWNDIHINTFVPLSGPGVPPRRELLLERASFALYGVSEGDSVTVELPDGKLRDIKIAGSVFDVNAPPPRFADFGSGYITKDTWEWLGLPKDAFQLRVVVAENGADRVHIQSVIDKIKDRVQDSGRLFFGSDVQQDPGRHYADGQIQSLLLILTVLGALSLFLSAFLVINTISAVMTQHTRQIGIMKAVGGRDRQITSMYLTMVAAFGVLSLLVAVPLGGLGAQGLVNFVAGLLNFDILTKTTPVEVLAVEIGVGLLVPLMAALGPIISGARLTVREAISSSGITVYAKPNSRPFLSHLRFIPRPLALSLRNTFRRKGRLALTMGTLILASAIFISVFSVKDSMLKTLESSLRYWSYDIEVTLANEQSEDRVINAALNIPGVVSAEAWSFTPAQRVREDRTESRTIEVIAPASGSGLIRPTLLDGRWLTDGDENGAVINTDVLADEPDLKVGDSITLKFEERRLKWQIVGVVQATLTGQVRNPRVIYVDQDAYRRAQGIGHQVRTLVVVTERHDGPSQAAVARNLEEQFRRLQMRVDTFETITDRRAQIEFQFNLVITFLIMMAGLLAVVGGLGLMGTMSINVLERTREIGVMRAIGASDGAVRSIVIVEGILIGLMSWAIGTALGFPVSKLLSDAVGVAFISRPLDYSFSVSGIGIWFGVVTVVAAISSFLPAWRASRLTVREVLAYE